MTSTETTAPCPTTFTFSVTNRDGSAIDTSLFTWDGTADTLTTFTNDFNYYNVSPFLLTAHVAYDGGYAIAGKLDFEVTIDISCLSAVFDTFALDDMTHSVFGTVATMQLVPVEDSVSWAVGTKNGLDFCGDREFAITDPTLADYQNFLELDVTTWVLTLGLPATQLSDIGPYPIEITQSLSLYPSITTTTTFIATIADCIVTSYTIDPVSSLSYNIYTPAITFVFTEFVQVPACAYTLDYTFYILDTATGTYSALPTFITEASKTFTVDSSDPLDVALYSVVVRGSVPPGFPASFGELIIQLDVANGC